MSVSGLGGHVEKRATSVEIAGRLLDVSRGVAYESARSGAIPTIRLGRRLVVPISKLADMLGETPESLTAAIEVLESNHRPCHAEVA
jgi:hypothetical protein